jgi:hypothetical protein
MKNSLDSPIRREMGDRKCLGDPRESIVGLPDAILFLPILRKGVFQQPQAISQLCAVCSSFCGSMSSIKRGVKKKLRPRPESEVLSRSDRAPQIRLRRL